MKTAKRQLKKMHRRTLALLALLVAIAFPAAAHNRTPLADLSPETPIEWTSSSGLTTTDEPPLPVVDAATIDAFDEAARIDIDLPTDPIAGLTDGIRQLTSEAEIDVLPIVVGAENRCSGFAISLTEPNLKETGELSLKLHWGHDHVRNRWFDPSTGSWLTPDPLGYRDSSNLYAFCGGDPVNGRDPMGLGEGDRTADAATAIAHGPSTRIGRRLDRFVVHQGKNLLGAAGIIILGGQASDPLNLAAKLQVGLAMQQGSQQINRAAGNWGTSAGELIEEPELLDQALQEVSEEDIDEAFDDATDLTMILATPLRGVGGKSTAVSAVSELTPTRVNPRHVAQAASVDELDALLTKLGDRAVREGARARAGGMSGIDAGNLADSNFGSYAEALSQRLAVQGSPYTVELQPAMLPGYGRVPAFVEFGEGNIFPFRRSLRLDAALSDTTRLVSTPAVSSDVYPTIMLGYDVTIDADKISAAAKYQRQFGVPIRDIRPK